MFQWLFIRKVNGSRIDVRLLPSPTFDKIQELKAGGFSLECDSLTSSRQALTYLRSRFPSRIFRDGVTRTSTLH